MLLRNNSVEDLAFNDGDGNNDGVPDRRQAHVASFPTMVDGTYVTLMSQPETALVEVRTVVNPSPDDVPPNITFPIGFQAFVIRGLAPGEATTVTLFPPPHVIPERYYKFGATADHPTPHWYALDADRVPGVEFLTDRVLLHFVDGQLGDDDLVVNGEIFDPGALAVVAHASPSPPPASPTPPAPPTTAPPGGGGGAGGGCTLNPDASMDITLLIALGVIITYLSWRRRAASPGMSKRLRVM